MADPKNVYHISTASIFKILVILLGLAFLWAIRDVLGLIFVSIILASAFDPMIDWLQRKKIPRGLGIILIYVVILALLSEIIYLVSDPVFKEISAISKNAPIYYQTVIDAWDKFQTLGFSTTSTLQSSLSSINVPQATYNVFGFVTAIFGSILAFFLVLVMTFYLTIEEQNMRRFVRSLAPDRYQPYLMQLISNIQTRLGYWLRGQLILSITIFILVYLGLLLLNVKYALVLALLAGAFEIVPFLGPILAAVPAIFLAFQQNPLLSLAVIVLYVIVQQLENNVIVPRVMGKVTGLNPIIVLIAILVGAKLAGIIGALLAIPVATALAVYFRDFSNAPDNWKPDTK